jgi:hypothetical protein
MYPLAGEGIVAKVDISKDTIFCHMSGHVLTKSQLEDAKLNATKYMRKNNWQPG